MTTPTRRSRALSSPKNPRSRTTTPDALAAHDTGLPSTRPVSYREQWDRNSRSLAQLHGYDGDMAAQAIQLEDNARHNQERRYAAINPNEVEG